MRRRSMGKGKRLFCLYCIGQNCATRLEICKRDCEMEYLKLLTLLLPKKLGICKQRIRGELTVCRRFILSSHTVFPRNCFILFRADARFHLNLDDLDARLNPVLYLPLARTVWRSKLYLPARLCCFPLTSLKTSPSYCPVAMGMRIQSNSSVPTHHP